MTVEHVMAKPPLDAMLGTKVIVAGSVLTSLYLGFHDPSWFQGAALMLLIGGAYLLAMHSYRPELEDGAVQLRSVYGRTCIDLTEVNELSISRLISSSLFALTFDRHHGPPVTWKVVLFGRNADAVTDALTTRLPTIDTGHDGLRYL